MKKYFVFITAALLLTLPGKAQETQDPFEAFRQQRQNEFTEYKQAVTQEYEAYEKAHREAFEQFKREVTAKWGEEHLAVSTQKDWVEYSPDKEQRTVVDFEQDMAKVELLLTPEEAENKEIINQKLEEIIQNLATTQGSSADYTIEDEKPQPLSSEPVLKDQLQTAQGEPVTAENAQDFAKEVVRTTPVSKETIKGADQKERVLLAVSLPLAPNSIQTRAAQFETPIQEFASKYQIDPAVVYAIMHTESYFNPKARSHVPAYGLMQIVPRYAGRDVYQYLHGEDKLVNADYLYNPQNNIEMGTTYMHLLLNRSFKKVENPYNRLLCGIAAYNTGAGNVSRAIIGTTKLGTAIPEINKLTPEQLYAHLRENLPYNETRDYIEKVTTRADNYKKWMEQ